MTEIISPDNQLVDDSGISTQRTQIWLDQVTDLQIITGTGTPEGIVSANVSRLYLQTDGTDGAVLFIKQLSDIGGDPKYGWVVCGGGGSASIALEDLTDVTITSVATGELLKWNGSAWVNNTLSEAGVQPEEDQRLSTTDSVEFLSVTTGNVIATGNITVTGTVDGRDIAVDGIKLDGIEAGADVTDTANVTAAGALMDSEVVNLDQVKNFDSADYATAAQGVTADNALPLSGGTMTGVIANFQSTGIDDNATSTALTLDSSQNATFAGDVTLTDGALSVTSDSNEAEIIASIQTSVWQTWKTSTNTIQGYDGFGTALGAPNSDDRVYRVQTGSHLFRNSSSTLLEIENGGNATFASDITGLTLNATGGTSAGDNAAMGYSSVYGAMITGQGSTYDTAIFNDANTAVMGVLTGTQDVRFWGRTLSADGSAASPSMIFRDDPDTGVYRPTTNQWAVATGGTNALTLDSSQNATLAGDINFSGASPNVLLDADNDRLVVSGGDATSSGANIIFYGDNHFSNANKMIFRNSGTTALTINASQDATFAGNVDVSSTGNPILRLTTTSATADPIMRYDTASGSASDWATGIDVSANEFVVSTGTLVGSNKVLRLNGATQNATFAGEIDASAGGIYLGGTAAANHLDDYEEGTWTPTNYTGSALNAKYIKIGNLVTVSVYLYGGTFTTINIGGLPFSPSTSNRYVSGTVGFTDTTNVTAIYAQTSSRLQFINKTTAVTPNNDRMMISCTYFVGI